MASETTQSYEHEKVAKNCTMAEVILRFLLFASALVAVIVMVTGKQTRLIPATPFPPFTLVSRSANFTNSPAFIYFVAALSVAAFYGLITTLISLYSLMKPGCCKKAISHFVILDVIFLGIMASATGTAGAVGYVGLKGNSHSQWRKICDLYGKYCRHIGASVGVSLFGSVVLLFLILLTIRSLSKKIPK